ncbi:hypothetical protein C8Q70DRAFT_694967 [Cubamyces menziesii]|nr:hypothetical protein C8Q70DRAFT_694967 [Cubamyces menziesii]
MAIRRYAPCIYSCLRISAPAPDCASQCPQSHEPNTKQCVQAQSARLPRPYIEEAHPLQLHTNALTSLHSPDISYSHCRPSATIDSQPQPHRPPPISHSSLVSSVSSNTHACHDHWLIWHPRLQESRARQRSNHLGRRTRGSSTAPRKSRSSTGRCPKARYSCSPRHRGSSAQCGRASPVRSARNLSAGQKPRRRSTRDCTPGISTSLSPRPNARRGSSRRGPRRSKRRQRGLEDARPLSSSRAGRGLLRRATLSRRRVLLALLRAEVWLRSVTTRRPWRERTSSRITQSRAIPCTSWAMKRAVLPRCRGTSRTILNMQTLPPRSPRQETTYAPLSRLPLRWMAGTTKVKARSTARLRAANTVALSGILVRTGMWSVPALL